MNSIFLLRDELRHQELFQSERPLYDSDVTIDRNIVIAKRLEPDLNTQWGLYLLKEDRWLDVVFKYRREAEEACAAVFRSPATAKLAGVT